MHKDIKIVLCMIVKNESAIIRETIAHYREICDALVICDTGSTDNTVTLAMLDAYVHEISWEGFGAARTKAIAIAQARVDYWNWDPKCTYLLIADADDRIEGHLRNSFDACLQLAGQADAFDLDVHMSGHTWPRPHLLRADREWVYRGVLHEYLDAANGPFERVRLSGPRYLASCTGARSQDPDKYQKDAATLLEALQKETDPELRARYAYYIGQSFRDAGDNRQGARWYKMRSEDSAGSTSERAHAALWAARLTHRCAREDGALVKCIDQIVDMYLTAYTMDPSRREPIVDVAQACREAGQHHMALVFAHGALAIPRPVSGLFLEEDSYTWRAEDEYATALCNVGCYGDAVMRWNEIERIPAEEQARIEGNIRFAREQVDNKVRRLLQLPRPAKGEVTSPETPVAKTDRPGADD